MNLHFLIAPKGLFVFLYLFLFCHLPKNLYSSSTTAQKAERLFSEKLYGDALPFYSLLFSTTEKETLKTEIALRLAACHLEEGHLQAAFNLLSPLKSGSHADECLYLLSLVHKKKGEFLEALNVLEQISALASSFPRASLIALEKGQHLLEVGHFEQAGSILKQISWDLCHPLPYYFAQLNLAKIYLLTREWKKAGEMFLHLDFLLPENHPLKSVERYLKGLFLLKTGKPAQAADYFESLLSYSSSHQNSALLILENLIISRLQQLLSLSPLSKDTFLLFSNIENRVKQLLDRSSSEAHMLLSADFYLMAGKHLSHREAYEKGKQLLADHSLTKTPEGKQEMQLKQAEMAPSYLERQSLYQHITQDPSFSVFKIKAWLLQGLNEFEEGMHHQNSLQIQRQSVFFERAVAAFEQVLHLSSSHKEETFLFYQALALKYLALSHLYRQKEEQAWEKVTFLLDTPSLLSLLTLPQEMYALAGWIALHLSNEEILKQAQGLLQKGRDLNSNSPWGKTCLKLQGMICFQLENWEEGERLFNQLAQAGKAEEAEALFWMAYSAGAQNKEAIKHHYLTQIYQKHPESPYAPLAFFHLYSSRDYMRGQRKAIKHLQEMPLLFPSHPLLISAYYLMGMDRKKDHLSEEGKILRRHDWLAAIDAFQQAESTFDQLLEKQLIPPLESPYFIQVREQSQLERGKLNFAIAQEATGGKRLIYLEYAEKVFKELIQLFLSSDQNHQQTFPYSKRWAEAEFQLAKIYKERGKQEEAEKVLDQALVHFKRAKIQEGSRVMRVWLEKGKFARQRKDYQMALNFFSEGEKIMHGKSIEPEDRLMLWIEQSLCHQALQQWDESMRLLSKVINADVISPLRIQAMFLRAEIYEQQGRIELALKQLEAISRQGGKWAQEAQNKMEKLL